MISNDYWQHFLHHDSTIKTSTCTWFLSHAALFWNELVWQAAVVTVLSHVITSHTNMSDHVTSGKEVVGLVYWSRSERLSLLFLSKDLNTFCWSDMWYQTVFVRQPVRFFSPDLSPDLSPHAVFCFCSALIIVCQTQTADSGVVTWETTNCVFTSSQLKNTSLRSRFQKRFQVLEHMIG